MVEAGSGLRKIAGGFSLVEMLIATTVFSFGMGGMAALMLGAAGGMAEAEHTTVAHLNAHAMAATLQLSPSALDHLAFPPDPVPLCFEGEDCTSEQWLSGQYALWRLHLARKLPGGAAVVCHDSTPLDGDALAPACDGAGPAVSKVFWRETRHEHDEDGGVRRAVVQFPQ
jgi:prepilin-type N-terminal cleavage/methylation domain-containing protein